MKVLVAIPDAELRSQIFRGADLERLSAQIDVDWPSAADELATAAFHARIARYDGLITGWGSPSLTRPTIDGAPRLRFIGHTAGSMSHLIDESVFDRGITVVNANTPLANSTAELCVTLMLAGAWEIRKYIAMAERGERASVFSCNVLGLQERTIGLVGFGAIARRVMEVLRPLAPRFLIYSNHCSPEQAERYGAELVELENLFATSDIISLHNTLTDRTRGMITGAHLDAIRDGCLLVNTARAAIIREEDLIASLCEERYNAALDVFHREPLERDSPLLRLPNVLCVPHIGAHSRHWRYELGRTVIDALLQFARGEVVERALTRAEYRQMTVAT
jgi:phosphoglycerate dehydrogenase-like enzyme